MGNPLGLLLYVAIFQKILYIKRLYVFWNEIVVDVVAYAVMVGEQMA